MTGLWYREGLQFECTRCGNCCTGFPGFVWVNDDELREIAAFRNEPLEVMVAVFTRMLNGLRSLREKLNHDCIFYDTAAGCTIYPVRPRQCRTWPFWESNVATPDAWQAVRDKCPGAGVGPLIPVEEITRRLEVIRL